MSQVHSEKRTGERVGAQLAVAFEGGHGITRDVSASGVFFETDSPCAPGGSISFSVNFDSPTGKMVLKCAGQVVRVEHHGERMGVAVQIVESVIEAAEPGHLGAEQADFVSAAGGM